MKKSTLFLLLALTIPVLIYFLGLGAAISSFTQGKSSLSPVMRLTPSHDLQTHE